MISRIDTPASRVTGGFVPEAVCLDMDGTLVDSERLWDVAVYELAEHMGRPLDEATRARTRGASLRGFFDILGEYTGRHVEGEELDRLATRLHERVSGLMATDLQWCAGARELLDDFAARGTRLALVTNTDAAVAAAPIGFLGRERFETIVTGDAVAHPKPAPDPYLLACERLEVDPARVVAVEDSVTGASSAVAAGLRVLYVPSIDGLEDVPGARRHTDLTDLDPEALFALTARPADTGAVGESPA